MSNKYFNWPDSLRRFVRFDAARSEDVNDALDEISGAMGAVEIDTKRALKLPASASDQLLDLAPEQRANLLLGFDPSGRVAAVPGGGRFAGDWATATAYLVSETFRDPVSKNIYSTAVAHTSTVIADDLAGGKIRLAINVVDVEAAKDAAAASASTAAEQAALATTNGAAQVTLAMEQVDVATEQAQLATTNGEAQVTLAAAQAALATAEADLAMGYRNTAGSHATTATDQAGIATTKAGEASTSAAAALASKNAAATSATTATTQAANAASSATAAAVSAASIADGPVTSVNGQTGVVKLALTDLQGATTIYVNQSVDYTITNYDSFSSYAVSVSAGSVARTDAAVTFTAPAAAGPVTLTVTKDGVARAIALTILPASVAAPTITAPANAATGITGPALTLTASAFAWIGAADTHLNTDWELWSGPGRTGTLLASSLADATNKTAWPITVAVGTTYYPAVRYRGATNGVSAWATSSFTTAANFNDYIATPAATPAAFGEPLEGGFYAGMIWNELVQSASSTVIGTGVKAFAVPSMSGAPIVYAGQTLEVRSRANPANKMIGTVTGAIGTSLTLNITSVGGGGTFADWSIMSQYRVIVAPKASGENAAIAWKNANSAAPVATGTLTEGYKATLAMVAADTSTVYPAAHWCNNLDIGGKTDWYMPARDELELCWRNLKPTTTANYITADRPAAATPNYQNLGAYGGTEATHGLNKNSSPAGAAYTSSVPGQTAATAFRTGGAEAYEFGSSYYWSSSEYSASSAWSQSWNSSNPGNQYSSSKPNTGRVRAVRRSII